MISQDAAAGRLPGKPRSGKPNSAAQCSSYRDERMKNLIFVAVCLIVLQCCHVSSLVHSFRVFFGVSVVSVFKGRGLFTGMNDCIWKLLGVAELRNARMRPEHLVCFPEVSSLPVWLLA